MTNKTCVFKEEQETGLYVISAMVKYSYDKEPKERFAGRDVGSGYSTGYPCWCDKNDNPIMRFRTIDHAKKWFHEEEFWLCRHQSAEVERIRILRIDLIPVEELTISQQPED